MPVARASLTNFGLGRADAGTGGSPRDTHTLRNTGKDCPNPPSLYATFRYFWTSSWLTRFLLNSTNLIAASRISGPRASSSTSVLMGRPKSGRPRAVSAEEHITATGWTTDPSGLGRPAHERDHRNRRRIEGSSASSRTMSHARVHDRHIHASAPFLADILVHVVAARLGHARPAITLRVYAPLQYAPKGPGRTGACES